MSDEALEAKKPWQSKTLWMSLIVSAAAFYPPASVWIEGNATVFSVVVGGLFAALRLATKGKVAIK